MKTVTGKSRLAVAISLFAIAGAANASILTPSAAGGTEALLSVVRVSNNDTITQDLGEQMSQIQSGDTYSLSASVQSFISNAGGLANVLFAVIGGDSTTRTYMTTTSSGDLPSLEIANSERNVWAGTLNNLTGTLNAGDATATTVNSTYGPFTTAQDGNFVAPGFDLWNGNYVVNTGPANADLFLYKVTYGTNNLQNASIASFFADPANSFARLTGSTLQIGQASEVPVPGAAWLLMTALIGLGRHVRRRNPR